MHKKRVLVLSGGGSKGSWQAGVIDYLLRFQGIEYDAICGVSVGAINGLHLVQYNSSENEEAAEKLLDFWRNISTDQVYKSWCFGKIRALCKPSFYDSRPLAKYLGARVDVERLQKSGKELRVGVVSLDSGGYQVYTEQDEDILKAVLASAAYPVMFLPVPLRGELCSDGGIRNVTPLKSAVDLGATDMDVVLCTPEEDTWSTLEDPNAIDVLGRMIDLMTDEIIQTDLKLALAYNEIAKHTPGQKRYIEIRVIRPEMPLPGSSLDFDDHIEEKIEKGKEDAKRVCG